mgnify:CR=1 FL=1
MLFGVPLDLYNLVLFMCCCYLFQQTLFNTKEWIGTLFALFLVCGQPSPTADPTSIIGGEKAERGEYPWQVALYDAKSKNLLCGGTLLNQRVVLTGKLY